jgi:hypothetical protein
MLMGQLPFAAADPMDWVHCHIRGNRCRPTSGAGCVVGPLSAMVMKLLAKTAEERYRPPPASRLDLRR